MKLRLFLSLFILGAVITTAFATTKALLSDQATLAANTFSTGTVDLQISKTNSTTSPSFSDSIIGFTGKITPGQSVATLLWLKNNSTDTDLDIAAQSSSISGEISPTDVTISFTSVNPDGSSNGSLPISHTLTTWNSVSSLNSILPHGGKQRYKMDVTLAPNVTSAGSTVFDFVFTGTQIITTPTPTP